MTKRAFHPPPPGASPSAHRAVQRIVRPVEHFLATEAAGGVVLLVAAAVALAWANSPWQASYHALWATELGVQVGEHAFTESLRFWIDDVLMTLFFFVVGLEIRREVARGELSDLRRASLPLASALGGMLVPALCYVALNVGRASASGWGVPMATDIAFAVGVLAVLGDRVPPALRIFLLALAVIDDVGAILVIGIFYSGSISLAGLVVAALGIVGISLLQRFGTRSPWLYVIPGAVVWWGIHLAGVHPTLAGVIVGLLTPAEAWISRRALVEVMHEVADGVRSDPSELAPSVDALSAAGRAVLAPVDLLQHRLHPWVAFVVMPLFALANAGVTLGGMSFEGDAPRVLAGVGVGLVLGKPIGIVLGAWIATKLGVGSLPRGVSWRGVSVVGLVGGIGFTMSLFVAELAFDATLLESGKLAILCASTLAGVLGLAVGALWLKRPEAALGAAGSESEAEASTVA